MRMNILQCCSRKWDISRLLSAAGNRDRLWQKWVYCFTASLGSARCLRGVKSSRGQRSGEPDHPAKSPLLFQLETKATFYILYFLYFILYIFISYAHLYLPNRWKKSLMQLSAVWLNSKKLRDESTVCSLRGCFQCPKDMGEPPQPECTHSHIAQRWLRGITLPAVPSSDFYFRADTT